ncbi:MAG: TIGR02757 family protein [Sulfurimonas sp.]|jgi:uncharacterized protein (TIGR02757 family)|nr:TIGR02757 family protein [Sulfurimonas sp.]
MTLKQRLDAEVLKRNKVGEVSRERLDPIFVAHRYNDERVALICALFAYGNVRSIVAFLDSLDFELLGCSDEKITKTLSHHYYRFQKGEDVIALFIALKRLYDVMSVEELFLSGYQQEHNLLDGLRAVITKLESLYPHNSRGYGFLLSKVGAKTKGAGALKRWMMYLRWMVRDDAIDMGLWSGVSRADLIIPLDTHTFHVSRKLGLLERKTYDLQAAIELTEKLKEFDPQDPLKYDFALYRLGQEKMNI